MSKERRLRKRINISYYLEAKDAMNDELLGNVIEINPAGFLLITSNQFVHETEYSVNIILPEMINDQKFINCIAVVSHTNKSTNPNFFEAGFEINHISSESKKIVEIIQDRWYLPLPSKK